MGALPLIALLVLDASAFQVSVLAALSAVASAVIALPLGVRIEHQYKRPVMVIADLARCVLLASIPVTMAFDVLTPNCVSSAFSRRRRLSRSTRRAART
ncbi:hypothetical protein SUDANB54_06933 [Streptomyces sp. enrichment culture]